MRGGGKGTTHLSLYLSLPCHCSRFPARHTSSSCNLLRPSEIFFPYSYTERRKIGAIGAPWVEGFLEGGWKVWWAESGNGFFFGTANEMK